MSYLLRSVEDPIVATLPERMVFLGGPRQVGKTSVSLRLLKKDNGGHRYFNWDDTAARSLILKNQLPLTSGLYVFDEIHKYLRWRNWLKGLYDTRKDKCRFLVTGSARLDHYRKGGDSLFGRYRYFRLHPFSLPELRLGSHRGDLEQLLRFGGFPEPFVKGSEKSWRLWQRERLDRVIYQDIRDLENVREISAIEILVSALPARVGSPLSIQNLSEDLQFDHKTISRWLQILDNIYLTYRILPYGSPKIRAVKKERKLYFWDWSQNEDQGARWENFVASHLLKYCHTLEDTEGFKMELRFLRDHDKREVDFVVMKEGKPEFAVECKTGERGLSPYIRYFEERTPIPFFYQVHRGKKDYSPTRRSRVLPFAAFCVERSLA